MKYWVAVDRAEEDITIFKEKPKRDEQFGYWIGVELGSLRKDFPGLASLTWKSEPKEIEIKYLNNNTLSKGPL